MTQVAESYNFLSWQHYDTFVWRVFFTADIFVKFSFNQKLDELRQKLKNRNLLNSRYWKKNLNLKEKFNQMQMFI